MTNALIFLGIYVFVSLGLGVLFFLWRVKSRKERPPVEFVLLRAPGESLRRKIASIDENLPLYMMLSICVPLLLAGGLLEITKLLGKPFYLAGLVAIGVVLVAGIGCIAWLQYYLFEKRRNFVLGCLGEREVGEKLDGLVARGYRVFHDIPMEGKGRKFNLDHAVVGPTGLFAIETKTRRKGRALTGRPDHQVFYNGVRLSWPWGEDDFGLQQARNEAEWLTKWVNKMTALQVEARPVLALPGWWVETKKTGPVSVQNAKNLESHILGRNQRILSDEQIELIARQLDARCRDVED